MFANLPQKEHANLATPEWTIGKKNWTELKFVEVEWRLRQGVG